MNPMMQCLVVNPVAIDGEDDDAKMPQLKISPNKMNRNKFPISPNAFYHKRQTRFTLPMTIIDKLDDKPKDNKPTQEHQEEVVYLLIISNQIRALCQKDKGKTKSSKQLQQRMIELNQFTDKYVDELWKRSNDIDIHKCIINISESLISAKIILEDALKVRFRRNSLFNDSLKEVNIDIGNRIAALEMTLSGENKLNYSHFVHDNQIINKATRGELQCIAGHRSYFGHGTKQNYQQAFEFYTKSSELNNSDGMNHLAMMYEKGIGCIQNMDQAVKYYKLSIDLQNVDAMANLANLYYQNFIYSDISKAIELYKSAADRGHIGAQITLASLYETGITNYLQPNIQLSIQWYRKAVEHDHLEAKNNLAVILLNNSDVNSKEYHQAVTFLTESATKGHAASQNNLGYCYEFGKGVEKDESKAFEWYHKSAAQNYSASFVNLGYLFLKRQQYENAFKYFLKASKNEDNIQSWYYLGLMHEKGYYVPINIHLALEYFEKASQKGHELATIKVGDCYFSGVGPIMQSYSKAFDVYRKLALDGNSDAANNVAIMYEEGLGVKIDIEAATMWYKLAAEKGNHEAVRNDMKVTQ
eukprot:349021_1